DALALVARQLGLIACSDAERLAGMCGAASRHGADHRVVPWIADLHDAVGIDLLAGDAHRLVTDFYRGFSFGHHPVLSSAALPPPPRRRTHRSCEAPVRRTGRAARGWR